jgi:hypothetical protein
MAETEAQLRIRLLQEQFEADLERFQDYLRSDGSPFELAKLTGAQKLALYETPVGRAKLDQDALIWDGPDGPQKLADEMVRARAHQVKTLVEEGPQWPI